MGASLKTLKLLQDAGVRGDMLLAIVASISEDLGEVPHKKLADAAARLSGQMPRMSRSRRLRHRSGPSWEKVRQTVFLRDHFICQYCGDDNPAVMTVDHVMPLSRDGSHAMDNLVTACAACNGDKADMTVEEWEHKRALASIAPPNRKPYTLKDLRREKLPAVKIKPREPCSMDAPTFAQGEKILARQKKDRAISAARSRDKSIVEGVARALAMIGGGSNG